MYLTIRKGYLALLGIHLSWNIRAFQIVQDSPVLNISKYNSVQNTKEFRKHNVLATTSSNKKT